MQETIEVLLAVDGLIPYEAERISDIIGDF